MKTVFAAQGNIISSLGFTAEENFSAMEQGRTGIQKFTREDFLPFSFYASLVDDGKLNEKFSALGIHLNYTRLKKIFILSIVDVIEKSGVVVKSENKLLII